MFIRYQAGDYLKIFAWFLIFFLAANSINHYVPEQLTADAILISIISLKNVTWFYWGQDRYLNLVPWLFSALQDRELNLLACLFTFSLSYYALLWILSGLLLVCIGRDRKETLDRLLLFLIQASLSILILQPKTAYTYIVEGQPYALSLLFIFVAFKCVYSNRQIYLRQGLAVLFIGLATGLNPSILLVTGAIYVALIVSRCAKRGHFIAFSQIVWFVFFRAIAKSFGTPSGVDYNAVKINPVLEHASAAFASINESALLWLPGGLLVFASIVLLLRVHVSELKRLGWLVLWGTLFALGWFGLMASLVWVQANAFGYRYFFPVILSLIALTGLILYVNLAEINRSFKIVASLFLSAGLCYTLVKPWRDIQSYPVFAANQHYADYARVHNVRFIAGDYWMVWPIVFSLHEDRQSAVGLTYRSDGIQPLAMQILQNLVDNPLQAMCLRASSDDCQGALHSNTGLRWNRSDVNCPVPECLLMEAKN